MPSQRLTGPSDARGRRLSAFVRERHASIDARGQPALSRSAGCVPFVTIRSLSLPATNRVIRFSALKGRTANIGAGVRLDQGLRGLHVPAKSLQIPIAA